MAHRRSRRSRRSHGGVALASHNDIGWSSNRSLAQGGDYFKYHEGQHGGGAPFQGADLSAIGGEGLPSQLRSSAHLGGLDNAFREIQGLRDQAGGKRKSRNRRGRKGGNRKSRKSRKGGNRKSRKGGNRKNKNKSRRRRRGGAMGYAPFPSPGSLLGGVSYAELGQNPQWRGVEVDMARARANM